MLRLISYLAPSIPYAFFELAGEIISKGSGERVELRFDERISGPLPGDENPFRDGTVDIGFICGPSYQWMRGELDLLPVPVSNDERAGGKPIYFADVIVGDRSPFRNFADLRDKRWAYNDKNSRSGWFSMVDRVVPLLPFEFFSELVKAGTHLESLRMVKAGEADAAGIDSNVLRLEATQNPRKKTGVRILESWGPFPNSPIVIRKEIAEPIQASIRKSLLNAHESFGSKLEAFGFVRFAEADPSSYEQA